MPLHDNHGDEEAWSEDRISVHAASPCSSASMLAEPRGAVLRPGAATSPGAQVYVDASPKSSSAQRQPVGAGSSSSARRLQQMNSTESAQCATPTQPRHAELQAGVASTPVQRSGITTSAQNVNPSHTTRAFSSGSSLQEDFTTEQAADWMKSAVPELAQSHVGEGLADALDTHCMTGVLHPLTLLAIPHQSTSLPSNLAFLPCSECHPTCPAVSVGLHKETFTAVYSCHVLNSLTSKHSLPIRSEYGGRWVLMTSSGRQALFADAHRACMPALR